MQNLIRLSKYITDKTIAAILLIAVFLSINAITGCQTQSNPKVTLISKQNGRGLNGIFYSILTIKNEGEQPAYFVIALVHAKKNGQEIGYKEKGFGDLFPNETKSDTVFFNNFGFIDPDTLQVNFTYQMSNSIPIN